MPAGKDKKILIKIKSFYEALFKNESSENVNKTEKLKTDLYNVLKSIQNNKSRGNDGLTKKFYEDFWDKMKELFITSLTEAKYKGEISISQRQAIIKSIERKIHKNLVTHFFIKYRHQNNFKSSFRNAIKKCSL